MKSDMTAIHISLVQVKSGYLHEMDIRVTTKLIQDKVQNFVRQQKATTESDVNTILSTATPTPASNPTLPAAGHVTSAATSSSTAATHSQLTTNQGSSVVTVAPVSASTPSLQTANLLDAAGSLAALSSDSGIVKSETNGSTVSSHPSEVGSSLHGSQQVPSAGQQVNTASNHADSAVSASSQPPSQSSSMSVAGSSVAITSQTTVIHQSLPVYTDPASSTANATATTITTDTDQASQISLASTKLVPPPSTSHEQAGMNTTTTAMNKSGSSSNSVLSNVSEVYANDSWLWLAAYIPMHAVLPLFTCMYTSCW